MISLIASHRTVAVVQYIPGSNQLMHRSIKSSRGKILGNIPKAGKIISLKSRNPAMRRPWIAVEYADGTVYAAQITRKYVLGPWREVPLA